MQKVVGSIPIASTTLRLWVARHTKALRRRSVRRSLLAKADGEGGQEQVRFRRSPPGEAVERNTTIRVFLGSFDLPRGVGSVGSFFDIVNRFLTSVGFAPAPCTGV